MGLQTGARLGPYEIIALIGSGGMGEVYRARDPKLNREIAIKVLLPALANDPDRLARFRREAEVLAAFNHPNIAAIYGLETGRVGQAGQAGVHAPFLVMELVEGEDLSQRIARGAIPLDEALPIARQIAEALEAAHEQGIIHRDLKPANVKVRADGTVKVLDFGLAKALEPPLASGLHSPRDLTQSPTITNPALMTGAGIILGTAAYMSPEQAAGKPVDKRSDLWSFGVVLLEMLSGQPVFSGETVSHVLASVLKSEPDWQTLPSSTPAPIRKLLARCLRKDRKSRLDSAAVARLEIEDAMAASPSEQPVSAVARRKSLWPWAIAAAAVTVAAGLAWRSGTGRTEAPLYASLEAPADTVLGDDDNLMSLPSRPPMVFTADGQSLIILAARAGKRQLFIRSLDSPDARPIPGTEDARVPFVSPDGKWVGFWAANELRKVPLAGGPVTTICPLAANAGPYGATWSSGDVIVFGDQQSRGLMQVPSGGGTPAPLSSPAFDRQHTTPFFLPDGKRVLFSDVSISDATDSRLMLQSLDGGDSRSIVAPATDGRLLPSGQLAFMRLGTLMIADLDLARAELTGNPVAAVSRVMQSGLRGRNGADITGAGMFAVSSLGTIAIVRGGMAGPEETRLIWMTADGRSSSAEPTSGAPVGGRVDTRISPDGMRAKIVVLTPLHPEVWLADWARNVWSQCSDCDGGNGHSAVWSPDGKRLLFGRTVTLVAHTLDGTAPEKELIREPGRNLEPAQWLTDGRILYLSSPPGSGTEFEIKLLDVSGRAGHVIVPIGPVSAPNVSPDQRWLSYALRQGNQINIVVQELSPTAARRQVSAGGGTNPTWSADGKTLYYLKSSAEGGSSVFAADFVADPSRPLGSPRELFSRPEGQNCFPTRCYDVAPGPRFLFRDRSVAPRATINHMDLILNWTATLATGR